MSAAVEIENLEEHFERMMELVVLLVRRTGGDVTVDFEREGIPELQFMVTVDGVEWVRVVKTGESTVNQIITPTMWKLIQDERDRRRIADGGEP